MNLIPIKNIILGLILGLATFYLMGKFFPRAKKNYYEITLSNGKIIRDSLKELSNKFEGDTVSYYKNQIISSKEIK